MTRSIATSASHRSDHTPPDITMAELIGVLSALTDDEDEIVATLLHMVEQRSVRLVVPALPTV